MAMIIWSWLIKLPEVFLKSRTTSILKVQQVFSWFSRPDILISDIDSTVAPRQNFPEQGSIQNTSGYRHSIYNRIDK